MHSKINEIGKKLERRILSEIPDKIVSIIIFGSYARGEESPDSDLDILIVTKEKTKELERKIFNIAYEIMWEYDFVPLISLEIVTETHLQWLKTIGSSFYQSIEKEGIKL